MEPCPGSLLSPPAQSLLTSPVCHELFTAAEMGIYVKEAVVGNG